MSRDSDNFVSMSLGCICKSCWTVWNDGESFEFCPYCDSASWEKTRFRERIR